MANPFGILFQPTALARMFRQINQPEAFHIFQYGERWHCFDAHSDLSGPTRHAVQDHLDRATDVLSEGVRKSTHIILTLGTAWVYRHLESESLVANCYKVPQRQFAKELLPVADIVSALRDILADVRLINPDAAVIFTVSPVRHIKDGFVENQRSKAHLITAVHEVVGQTPETRYFPAYEIMTDDLRDYRFYAADMLHPSPMAVDYIWDRFSHAWISTAARGIMTEVDAVRRAEAHRPFDPTSKSYTAFLVDLRQRKSVLSSLGVSF